MSENTIPRFIVLFIILLFFTGSTQSQTTDCFTNLSVSKTLVAKGFRASDRKKAGIQYARSIAETIAQAYGRFKVQAQTLQYSADVTKYTFKSFGYNDSLAVFCFVIDNCSSGNKETAKLRKAIAQNQFQTTLPESKMPVTVYYYAPDQPQRIILFSHYGMPDYYKNFDIAKILACIVKENEQPQQ